MNETQNWAEALNISPEKLTEWSADSREGMPLLVWCLHKGHVDLNLYLQWASEHYGLPILNSSFFSEAFDRENLSHVRNQGEWAAWCYPVKHWDDVTVVACVEPPGSTPEGQFAFVLADPSVLIDMWGSSRTRIEVPIPQVDAPIGVNLNQTNIFQLNLSALGLSSESTSHEETRVSLPSAAISESELHEEVEEKTIHNHPPKVSLVSPARESQLVTAGPVRSLMDEILAGFERLKISYHASLVMICEENLVKVYKWDPILELKTEPPPVSLTNPSFFRIVAKTLQPYHGYVVETPAHRDFFASVNQKELPTSVTAVPIKMNNILWGMLIAFGGDLSQTPESLQSTQLIADKLSNTLARSAPTAA